MRVTINTNSEYNLYKMREVVDVFMFYSRTRLVNNHPAKYSARKDSCDILHCFIQSYYLPKYIHTSKPIRLRTDAFCGLK